MDPNYSLQTNASVKNQKLANGRVQSYVLNSTNYKQFYIDHKDEIDAFGLTPDGKIIRSYLQAKMFRDIYFTFMNLKVNKDYCDENIADIKKFLETLSPGSPLQSYLYFKKYSELRHAYNQYKKSQSSSGGKRRTLRKKRAARKTRRHQ